MVDNYRNVPMHLNWKGMVQVSNRGLRESMDDELVRLDLTK